MEKKQNVPALRFPGFSGEWKKKRLEEMGASFSYGLNAAATTYDGQHKYLRITDIDDESRKFSGKELTSPNVDLSNASDYLDYKLQENDIVFARTGASVGKTYLYDTSDGDVYYAGFLIRVKIDSKYDANFIFQKTLTSDYSHFVVVTSQRSGQPGINAQEYANWEMLVPELNEQKKIGRFLTDFDKNIFVCREKIKKLQQFRQAMLAKLFPREGAAEPALRFQGFFGPWRHTQISDIADVIGGGTPDTQIEEYWNGDIDWYTPAEMEGKRYANGSDRKITELGLAKSGARLLPAHRTVLFTSRAGIGKMAILGKDGATNQGFQSLVLNDYCDPYFIYTLGPFITKCAERIAAGSTFLEISGKALGALEIMIPTKAEQEKIAKFFEKLDDIISLQQEMLDKIQKLKAALLEKLFV